MCIRDRPARDRPAGTAPPRGLDPGRADRGAGGPGCCPASPRSGGGDPMTLAAGALLEGPLEIVHLGIEAVVEAPEATGARVTRVDFQPPAGGDPGRIAR